MLFLFTQVISRKHGVRPNNKAKNSVITNTACIQIGGEFLQKDVNLKPKGWMKLNEVPSHIQKLRFSDIPGELFESRVTELAYQNSEFFRELERIHFEQFSLFVQKALEDVASCQVKTCKNGDDFEDNIDLALKEKQKKNDTLTCALCKAVNSKFKRFCQNCGKKEGLDKAREDRKKQATDEPPRDPAVVIEFEGDGDNNGNADSERYGHIVSFHEEAKKLIVLDPVFANPNSLKTVAVVLRHIGESSKVKKYCKDYMREWVFVVCDGLPHGLCEKLIMEAVVCHTNDCNKSFLSLVEFSQHCNTSHQGAEVSFSREFDWIYLLIGDGHNEINLLRAFFELNWTPFIKDLASEMSFTSENAQRFAKNGKDHHTTWQLALVFHNGALRELVLPYVRHCARISPHTKPSVNGFYEFIEDDSMKKCPNFGYLYDQISRYSQGIINFRMGIRRNNFMLVESARFMTKELFYGRNHPKYRDVELFQNIQQLFMPEQVKQLLSKNVSITITNDHSSGEGYDYKLEDANRDIKRIIPAGKIPSDNRWRIACRNHGTLQELDQSTMTQFCLSLKETHPKPLFLSEAINAWQRVIRENHMLPLSLNDAEVMTTHKALDGTVLNTKLSSFTSEATLKRVYAILHNVLGKKLQAPHFIQHPVYITPEEERKFTDLNNQSKDFISKEIEKMLILVPNDQERNRRIAEWKSKKSSNKDQYVIFYSQLSSYLDTVLGQSDAIFDENQ